jgi:hypothetical protein
MQDAASNRALDAKTGRADDAADLEWRTKVMAVNTEVDETR